MSGILQRLNRAPAHVRLAHPNHQTDDDRPLHQPLAMLRSRRIMLVDMQRVLVHAQQAEQRVVELSDGPAGPVPKRLARFQFFEVAAVFVACKSRR